jgi:chromosome segregation ATPase
VDSEAEQVQAKLANVEAEYERSRVEVVAARQELERVKAELRASVESGRSREAAWEKDRATFLRDKAGYEKSLLQIRELPELKSRLADTEAQARLVKNQLDAARERIREAEGSRAELENAKRGLFEYETRQKAMLTEAKSVQSELQALRNALREAESRDKSTKLGDEATRVELQNARDLVQQSSIQLRAAKTEADLARTEASNLKKKVADLSSERAKLIESNAAQLSVLKRELEGSARESLALRGKLHDIQVSSDSAIQAAKASASKLENAVLELQNRLESARDENEQLRLRLQESETGEQANRVLENQLKETRTSLEIAQKKARESEELACALTESKESIRQGQAQIDALRASESELKELRLKYQKIEARAAEAEALRDENRQLREDTAELKNLSKTSAELEAISAEYRRVGLESELLNRRVEELTKEREKVIDMASHVEDLENAIAELGKERERRRELEATLFALRSQGEEAPQSVSPISIATLQSDMQSSLALLLQLNGIRSAVLADGAGLLVAGVGDEAYNDGLAAMSGLVEGLVLRLQDLLPISRIDTVSLQGSHGVVVSTRIFPATDGNFSITTLGLSIPPLESVNRSIALLGRQIDPEQ